MLPGRCLHEIFEARVCGAPRRVAVSILDEEISYGDLDLYANRLAQRLQALGVGPDVLVGLCVDRSIEMIIGLLAILKAGGAYVPIDPCYPANHIQFLLRDSAVSVVVTLPRVADCLGKCDATVVYITRDPILSSAEGTVPLSRGANDRNLAYAIYTSGSTGTPKGVLVEHRSVVRLFDQTWRWFRFDAHDVWTMFHSTSFDFSVWEIWGALLYGGHLVIVPSEVTRSPWQFHSLLRDKHVTVLNQTPSAFRQLEAADLEHRDACDFALRLVIFGGEALEVKLLGPWIARHGDQKPELINMYGITESTVHVTYRRILNHDLEHQGVSPIGIPIPDLQVHLLDESAQPVGDGIPGELYISGPGVARGYLRRPKLTAQRFLFNRTGDSNETRMYRSGDRALRTADGEFIYIGRTDDQIKVRGFRIEPREIELCLSGHPHVATTVVHLHDYGDGDVRLLAYVVPKYGLKLTGQEMDELRGELAACAAAGLPAHMRPSSYCILPELPLTDNGKINRHALPLPEFDQCSTNQPVAPFMSETEQLIARIWGDVLKLKEIATSADFFDLGGTSIAFVRMFGRINEGFHISLDWSVLGDGTGAVTIAHLAASVDSQLQNQKSQIAEEE